uniref:Retinitis pigmentosa 1-like 1 n=1 Tax=Macrostomum lignano TaxID=282301 RepID=A0A1I8H1N8_9PLAT
ISTIGALIVFLLKESEELEAKRSPAPDREPTARPQRRVKPSNSAASPAAPVEDSEATEEIANELESVDNPDELEKSEYAPESEELETKRSPAPDREPTASPKRRVRSSRLRRILSFFRRASWRSRRGSGSKSTAMSDSAAEWRRRRGRRFRGRLIRRLRSLADLLDGLNRTTVGCSTVDESQRRSLGRWARRLKPFLLPRKNSTAPIEAEPRSPEAVEEAVNDDSAE